MTTEFRRDDSPLVWFYRPIGGMPNRFATVRRVDGSFALNGYWYWHEILALRERILKDMADQNGVRL